MEELVKEIADLKALVNRLLLRIEELEAENADLRRQLGQNSSNSHKPPSSEGYSKKPLIKAALPKSSGKKPGGQSGHPGKTLQLVEYPDEIHTHSATHCGSCGLALEGEGQVVARRQVFDLPPTAMWVSEHQLVAHRCQCGCEQTGRFPANVVAPVQYGARIHAQSIVLNVDYRLPFAKISQLWADLTGYAYNPATLISAQTKLYEQLNPIETQIKEQLKAGPVCHFDETGLRVDGGLKWLHLASNEQYTYFFVHDKRGQEALLSQESIFPDCVNWTIHDCWASYFTVGKGRHSLCGAHLLRELQALIEQGCQWAKAMHDYLMAAYEATRHGPIGLNQQALWRMNYQQICQQADLEEHPAITFFKPNGSLGKPKRTKGRNLLQRLIRHEEAVLAFAFESGVPFTNNQAERDLRTAKVKQKISNCFRRVGGANAYARIASFISTIRKMNRNIMNNIENVLMGNFEWAT
jgi:transposase